MRRRPHARRIKSALESLESRQLLAAIASGQTIVATIANGQSLTYTFNASAKDSIRVAVGETVAGSALYPRVELIAPNGTSIGGDYGSAGARVAGVATVSGTYSIVVSDYYNGGGAVAVTMAKGPATQATSADDGPISSGQTRAGTIGAGDIDVYTFSANAGEAIRVAVAETLANSPLYPVVEVVAPNGALLGGDYGSVGATFAGNATTSGTYTAFIYDYYAATGAYAVTMAKGPGTHMTSADDGPITSGKSVAGTLGAGDIDVFNIAASAGDSIFAKVAESAASSPLYPLIELISPTGAVLASDYGSVGAAVSARAAVAGNYTLVVRDYYSATGAYGLTMVKAPGVQATSADDGPIAVTQTRSGNLTAGDIDVYTFSATAGDAIRLSLGEAVTGSALYPLLTLVGPNGATVGSDYGSAGAAVNATASLSGHYTILVRDYYSATGTYNLTLTGNIRPFNAPEVGVFGNSVEIVDGDSTPSAADHADFGSTTVGTIRERTFTVKNTGTGALTTSSLKVPTGYTVVEGLSASIAAGASDTFKVKLNATAAGTFAGDISFANNDSNENPYNFRVSGIVNAAPPPFAVLSGGVLTVTGTSGNDFIRASIASNVLTVRMNSLAPLNFANASAINRVVVNGNAGNDLIMMAQSMNRPTSLNGGDGNDTLYGGAGTDVINGGAGTDVAFRSGSDTATLVEEVLS